MAAFWRENQLIQIKKGAPRRPHDLKNEDSTQGFNSLQTSPNQFLGIWTLGAN